MKRSLLVLLFACGTGVQEESQPPPSQVETPPPSQQQQQMPLTGLPCDVQAILQANCAGCHVGAVYIPSFASRHDLMSVAPDGQTLGATAVKRMENTEAPMPPANALRRPTADERQVIANWVAAGMPAGTCGGLQ